MEVQIDTIPSNDFSIQKRSPPLNLGIPLSLQMLQLNILAANCNNWLDTVNLSETIPILKTPFITDMTERGPRGRGRAFFSNLQVPVILLRKFSQSHALESSLYSTPTTPPSTTRLALTQFTSMSYLWPLPSYGWPWSFLLRWWPF